MRLRIELEKVLREQSLMAMIADNYEKELARKRAFTPKPTLQQD